MIGKEVDPTPIQCDFPNFFLAPASEIVRVSTAGGLTRWASRDFPRSADIFASLSKPLQLHADSHRLFYVIVEKSSCVLVNTFLFISSWLPRTAGQPRTICTHLATHPCLMSFSSAKIPLKRFRLAFSRVLATIVLFVSSRRSPSHLQTFRIVHD